MYQTWPVLCAWGMLLLRIGMAIHEAGSVRAKNSATVILRSAADMALAVLAFWLVGGALFFARDSTGIISFNIDLLGGRSSSAGGRFLVGMAGVTLAGAIIGGIMAERSRMAVVLACSVLLAAVAAPVAGFWARAGWLHRLGFHDLAGASFIHMVGAVFGLVGAICVGGRLGKYNRDGSSNAIPGHNVPLAGIGLLLMLVCWVPYVSAFALLEGEWMLIERIGTNLMVAAAGGALAAMLHSHLRYGKVDFHLAFGGLVGAAVAISAGADVLAGWAALLVGIGAGLLVPLAAISIDLRWHVDDPTGGISMHGIGGAWGLLATGILAPAASLGTKFAFIGAQILGLVVIAAFSALLAMGLISLLRPIAHLRSKEADESDGLDLAEHDIGAYPDFQQNTIKSYHLREA